MALQATLHKVADDRYGTEEVTSVTMEIAHAGSPTKPLRTWTWTPTKTDEIRGTSRGLVFTVRNPHAVASLGKLGAWSGTVSAVIKRKPTNPKKPEATRTVTAHTTFSVVAFEAAMAFTRDHKDDIVQIRSDFDKSCQHHFYEPIHVWLKGPGAASTMTSDRQAPFVTVPGSKTTAPTTTRTKSNSVHLRNALAKRLPMFTEVSRRDEGRSSAWICDAVC